MLYFVSLFVMFALFVFRKTPQFVLIICVFLPQVINLNFLDARKSYVLNKHKI